MVEAVTTFRADNASESGRRRLAKNYRMPKELSENPPCFSDKTVKNQTAKLSYNEAVFNSKIHKIKTNTVTSRDETLFLPADFEIQPDIWNNVKKGIQMEKTETMLAEKRSRAGIPLPKQNCGRVRDLVALKTGFKSANSYIAAKTVYLNANHEIKKIVTDGIIKITPASKIAKLDMNKQIKTAKIIRLMSANFKNPKRAVTFFVNSLLAEPGKDLDNLLKTISDGIKNGETCFKQILNCSQNKSNNYKENQGIKNEPRDLKKISDIHQSLSEFVIFESQIASLDKKQVDELDRNLSHIEKAAKNFRRFIREKSSFFEDSFNDSVKHYRSQFIETIQFFAHTLLKNLDKTDEDLLADLHRTFHNSTTILYNVATVTARQIRY